MEYVQMGSMDKLLLSRGKSLRMRQRLAISEQVCSGMCELASAGVLHRDLAGRNILVAGLDPVSVKVGLLALTCLELPSNLPSVHLLICAFVCLLARCLILDLRGFRLTGQIHLQTHFHPCQFGGARLRCCPSLNGRKRAMCGPSA